MEVKFGAITSGHSNITKNKVNILESMSYNHDFMPRFPVPNEAI